MICDRKQIFPFGQSRTESSPPQLLSASIHDLYTHVKISEDLKPSLFLHGCVFFLLVMKGPFFFGVRVKETGWSACHAIKDAVRESRHDFMANDSRANISVGCRGDNQVELS